MFRRCSPANIGWFLLYVLMLAGVTWGLSRYRSQAVETYSTAKAGSDWQDWRAAAERIGSEGPVQRTAPKSIEPPALVLMRDHFPACLGISLLLSSCLFLWFMICVRGAMRPSQIAALQGETDST